MFRELGGSRRAVAENLVPGIAPGIPWKNGGFQSENHRKIVFFPRKNGGFIEKIHGEIIERSRNSTW
jgi:hypothetical protein